MPTRSRPLFGLCALAVLSVGLLTAPGAAQAKTTGTVVAWGCGDGANSGHCSVPSGLAAVTAIAAGSNHSLALAQLADQTITFRAPAIKTYGDPDFAVSATASSGLTVSFAVSGKCTVSGATVHLTGAGVCTITASQAGNVSYNPAPDVSRTFTISRTGQTITFGPLAGKTYGAPDFSLSATASSGLAVSYAASGNCTVSGVTVHLTGAGSCTVIASQAGDANYRPARAVSRAFSIAKGSQSITFGPLANKRYGARPFRVTATASSGLAVFFEASGKCRIIGSTVHLTGAGSCTVTAWQPGDANYTAAPLVSRTFSIARSPCRVPKVVGKPVASATRTIAARHCRRGKLAYAYSRKSKKGIVMSQSRRPGRVLPAGSKINLIVSRGRRR